MTPLFFAAAAAVVALIAAAFALQRRAVAREAAARGWELLLMEAYPGGGPWKGERHGRAAYRVRCRTRSGEERTVWALVDVLFRVEWKV